MRCYSIIDEDEAKYKADSVLLLYKLECCSPLQKKAVIKVAALRKKY